MSSTSARRFHDGSFLCNGSVRLRVRASQISPTVVIVIHPESAWSLISWMAQNGSLLSCLVCSPLRGMFVCFIYRDPVHLSMKRPHVQIVSQLLVLLDADLRDCCDKCHKCCDVITGEEDKLLENYLQYVDNGHMYVHSLDLNRYMLDCRTAFMAHARSWPLL